jgi:hypothetical protein
MAPVLPMLVPKIPSVDAAEDKAGDYDAVFVQYSSAAVGGRRSYYIDSLRQRSVVMSALCRKPSAPPNCPLT